MNDLLTQLRNYGQHLDVDALGDGAATGIDAKSLESTAWIALDDFRPRHGRAKSLVGAAACAVALIAVGGVVIFRRETPPEVTSPVAATDAAPSGPVSDEGPGCTIMNSQSVFADQPIEAPPGGGDVRYIPSSSGLPALTLVGNGMTFSCTLPPGSETPPAASGAVEDLAIAPDDEIVVLGGLSIEGSDGQPLQFAALGRLGGNVTSVSLVRADGVVSPADIENGWFIVMTDAPEQRPLTDIQLIWTTSDGAQHAGVVNELQGGTP